MADEKNEKKEKKEKAEETEYVKVKKADLEGILARFEQMDKETRSAQRQSGLYAGQDMDWKATPEEEKVYTATMRTWKEEATDLPTFVYSWRYSKDVFNERTRQVEQIYTFNGEDWEGKSVEFQLPLLDFVKKAERVQVNILDKKIRKLSKTTGAVNASRVQGGYNTVVGGKVPLVETMNEITLDIQTEDGRIFRGIPERYLNA